MNKALVIGSGFAGLSAATSLAHQGWQVTLLEKNSSPGGRARSFTEQGFTFDMGPSWYWMPDVFEQYFARFGRSVSDYYRLKRLDPSYRVYFGEGDYIDLPASLEDCYELFEREEEGSGDKLRRFILESAYKYEVGINDLVYKPGRSFTEFLDWRVAKGVIQLDLFKSMRRYVHQTFQNPRLRQLVEFPILFLGGTPQDTPALYSLMNYADMALGTWYPEGGMHKIVEGMVRLAQEKGVEFVYNAEVTSLEIENNEVATVLSKAGEYRADVVVAGADYHHVEQHLLPASHRQYSEKYWQGRAMAPSSLLFYLGVNKSVANILHHNLFFDEDFDAHAREIYEKPQWPSNPLFYVCAASKTDATIAPKGHENVFLLVPVAPDLKDEETTREKYFDLIMSRLERIAGVDLKQNIVYKRSFAHNDFIDNYYAFKGNAYGLANTLKQTAILKPALKSKKVKNLYYTGQLTVPGPGVPPSLISGQVVAREIEKDYRKKVQHESVI